jgi:hypothetical protein
MSERTPTDRAIDPHTRALILKIALGLLLAQVGIGFIALWQNLPVLGIGLLICGPVGYGLCRWRWLADH